ncbi:hypothetical protein [Afipia carboxidovorans]|nr:hypothetical protein [Afipia carboxidovorans]
MKTANAQQSLVLGFECEVPNEIKDLLVDEFVNIHPDWKGRIIVADRLNAAQLAFLRS